MQESARAGKEKKKSPLTFGRDIKGNVVWSLRSAVRDDIELVGRIVGPVLPESIITSLVEDSEFCTVCDVSVKGTKEGEGYRNIVMGCALVDVGIVLRGSNIVKHADFITVMTHDQMPDDLQVRRKLVLGSLKKMKDAGVSQVTSTVASDNSDRIDLLTSCLFKTEGASDVEGGVRLVCNLSTENPDPEKKML
ncbi:unnamed protein product [Agarophyton chilense]